MSQELQHEIAHEIAEEGIGPIHPDLIRHERASLEHVGNRGQVLRGVGMAERVGEIAKEKDPDEDAEAKEKSQNHEADPFPGRHHSPRYAFRISGLRSSSCPVPVWTTEPVSRT